MPTTFESYFLHGMECEMTHRALYDNLIENTIDYYSIKAPLDGDITIDPNQAYPFDYFLQDIEDIESNYVIEEYQEEYDKEDGYSGGSISIQEACDWGFMNYEEWRDAMETYSQEETEREDRLYDFCDAVIEIYEKHHANKIGEFYLKAKYNPRTPIGKKFVESLYDENF